jgi:site-specific DNA-adenine methylase
MNWKEELPNLYRNINPPGGILKHSIDRDYNIQNLIQRIIVEFNEMDFDYFDPLYKQHNAKSNFKMYFVFSSEETKTRISSIYDIENKEFFLNQKESQGAFSNSLILTVTKLKFGNIIDGKVSIEFSYFLTDSNDFKYGEIQEHADIIGHINTILSLKDIIVSVHKEYENIDDVIKQLPTKYYETENVKPATEANYTPRDYNLYQIPIRDNR